MNRSDFKFDLPDHLIAQRPSTIRDQSRLMVIHRHTSQVEHQIFSDLPTRIGPDDVLVVNDSRVRPLRLIGRKSTGGKVDVLLVKPSGSCEWEALIKGIRTGRVLFPGGPGATVTAPPEGGKRIHFDTEPSAYLAREGLMPLPPYIRRTPDASDEERYQTVYASPEGSIAAPTAGLHFTDDLMETLRSKGTEILRVTLHVGPGTFLPVKHEDLSRHRMTEETYSLSQETAEALNHARKMRRRVIAVGTTVTRTLETAFDGERFIPGSRSTSLFIYPGYSFQAVQGLITNFHLPQATPLMLVSAFLGQERTRSVYRLAVSEGYRFFSYGDAMLIL